MGIPTYFSHIVKNHSKIIKKLIELNKSVDNLYLDSNSIIYDVLGKLSKENKVYKNIDSFEEVLIKEVCMKIDTYINITRPSNRVIIAFDGVAPVAKLKQQRDRRYKSVVEKEIFKNIKNDTNKENNTQQKSPEQNNTFNVSKWNKTAITPGTNFMKKLNETTKKYFNNYVFDKDVFVEVIVSGTDEEGEGEHKIFEFIRDNVFEHKSQITLIYGLDADLIMLCLNHLPITRNLYLYRETPEFIKSLNSDLNPNEHYVLDIPMLSREIKIGWNNQYKVGGLNNNNKLYDYIFICFFLGNDFLPHFPAINIRTKGINILLDAYNAVMDENDYLFKNGVIVWKNVNKFVKYLSDSEYDNLIDEYKIRNKWEKYSYPCETEEEKYKKYLNLPLKNRSVEKYIDPYRPYWKNRYYSSLFQNEYNNDFIKKVCMNYLEGLEWVMQYYTFGCIDWRWKYKYNYPPLMSDLIKYIPQWECSFLEKKEKNPVTSTVQLGYVLPRNSLYLIPKNKYIVLLKHVPEYYEDDGYLQWSFCKYIWESHALLPEIDINQLEYLLN
jgi:5'-3' exoribonuclease 1